MKKYYYLIITFLLLVVLLLTSCHNDKTIVIDFDTNCSVDVESKIYTCGKEYKELPTIKRTGYIFDGWYIDDAYSEEVNVSTIVDKKYDVLYAKWSINKYSLLASGDAFTLAIDDDGNFYSWGNNSLGILLGTGDCRYSTSPKKIIENKKFKHVSAFGKVALALDTEGYLYYWGGFESIFEVRLFKDPVLASDCIKFVYADAGSNHILALDENGDIWSLGMNTFCQLGTPHKVNFNICKIESDIKFQSVSAGNEYSYAIDLNGDIYVWGYTGNFSTSLSNTIPLFNNNYTTTYKIDCGDVNFKNVSGGAYYSLAISEDDELYGWGLNQYGQLGNNQIDKIDNNTPTCIFKNTYIDEKITRIYASEKMSCAISESGKAYIWGKTRNITGDENDYLIPMDIFETNDYSYISCGKDNFVIGMKEDSIINSMGFNYITGYLGIGKSSFINKPTFAQLNEDINIKDIYNAGSNMYIIDETNQLYRYFNEQNNTSDSYKYEYEKVLEGEEIKSISNYSSSVAAITTEGKMYVWGANDAGQLGIETKDMINLPTLIEGIRFKSVQIGKKSYAIDIDGNIWVCGIFDSGFLGDENNNKIMPWTKISEGIQFESLSANDTSIYAIDFDGYLWLKGRELRNSDKKKIMKQEFRKVNDKKYKKVLYDGYSLFMIDLDGNLYGYGDNYEIGIFGDKEYVYIDEEPYLISTNVKDIVDC